LIFNILKNHPKALLLLIRKRKSFDINKLKSESKFLSLKRTRDEINDNNETSAEEDKNKEPNEEQENESYILKNIEKFETEIELNEENSNNNFYNLFCKYDQFYDEENDPYKTIAQNSCLWELFSLKSQYNFKIGTLVHKFERNFFIS